MVSQRKAGALLGYTNIFVKNLVNLVYTPMLLHFVGQAEYGVYQSTNSFVFSLTLLTFGFSGAYVRFYMQERASGTELGIRRLNGMYLILYVIVSLTAFTLGLILSANAKYIFAKGFTEDEISLAHMLIIIMSANIACTLFSTVFDSYILAHERFTFQQSRQLFTTLAAPFLSLIFLELGFNVIGVAIAQFVITLVLLMLNMRYSIGTLKMRFDIRHFDTRLFKAVAVFSTWIFTNQICELINQSLPNVVLGALSGATTAAVFAVAVQIRSVFYSLSGTMANVFTPLINRIVAEHDDNTVLTRLMTRVGRYQAILYMWVLGGFILLGRFFVQQWAGDSFSDAYWLIVAMATPLFIPLVQNTGLEIQRAKNRHKARSIAYLCMAVVNVALTVILAPYISYWAPAVGYIAYVILGCGLFMNWFYQHGIGLDIKYFWKKIIKIPIITVFLCFVFMIGIHYFPVTNWFRFVLWGISYTILYGFAVYIFALNAKEKKQISTLIFHQINN